MKVHVGNTQNSMSEMGDYAAHPGFEAVIEERVLQMRSQQSHAVEKPLLSVWQSNTLCPLERAQCKKPSVSTTKGMHLPSQNQTTSWAEEKAPSISLSPNNSCNLLQPFKVYVLKLFGLYLLFLFLSSCCFFFPFFLFFNLWTIKLKSSIPMKKIHKR